MEPFAHKGKCHEVKQNTSGSKKPFERYSYANFVNQVKYKNEKAAACHKPRDNSAIDISRVQI